MTSTRSHPSPAALLAAFGAVLATLMILGGIALISVHLTQRDSHDHYYRTHDRALTSPGRAVTSERLETGGLPASGLIDDVIGRLRFGARTRNGKPIFIGIGPRRAVDAYLSGVARTQVDDLDDPSSATTTGAAARSPATPPAAQPFWTSSSSSVGATHVDWQVAGPDARLVVMNADASPGVAADVNVGVKTDLVLWIGLGLAILGLAGLGGSIAAFAAVRSPRPRP